MFSCTASFVHASLEFPPRKDSRFREKNHLYTVVLGLDAIEVSSSQEPPLQPTVIVAFGDSITQQGEWMRPLAAKLFEVYQDRVVLLNKGIGGNASCMQARVCLAYSAKRHKIVSSGMSSTWERSKP